MSHEDVETAREGFEAWESEGVEGLIPFLDAEVEWRTPADGLGGVFFGHEGVREWSRQVDEVFDEVHFEVDRIEDLPDERLLAVGRGRFKGRGSGVEMEIPFAYLIEFRDGKAVAVTQYTNIDAAQVAAGLAE
jgi:ketosteroid isomerase-like protein